MSTGISFNFMKFVCLILCYILYVFYWTWYWRALLCPPLRKVAIDWWWRVSPCLHLAGRRMVLLLLHICTQAQGPANSVSFPSNKKVIWEEMVCPFVRHSSAWRSVFFFFFFYFVLLFDLFLLFQCTFPLFCSLGISKVSGCLTPKSKTCMPYGLHWGLVRSQT